MIVLSREPGGLSLYQQLYRQLRGQIASAGVNALAAAPSGYYMLKYSGEEIDTKLGKI